jgi:hypothetical protein
MELTEFTLVPNNDIDVTSGPDTLTCRMRLTEVGAEGVTNAGCQAIPPAGDGAPASCSATLVSGDADDGYWECLLTFSPGIEPGVWTFDYVFGKDTALNQARAIYADLSGFAERTVDVTSPVEDTTPPNIQTFTALPNAPNPGNAVTCAFVFNPLEEPIRDVSCTFASTDGILTCIGNGVDTCDLDIPAEADGGVLWSETGHSARDLALNTTLGNDGLTFQVEVAQTGCGTFVADYTANNGWSATQSETVSSSTLTTDFYVKPTALNQNALIAFSQTDNISTFSTNSMIIRFGNAGIIEVYDGSGYGCKDITCPTYETNVWYHFEITANMETDIYTVKYETCDDGYTTISTDAAFRSTAPHASVAYHAAWDESGNDFHVNLDTEGNWTPGVCDPLTCAEQSFDCGTASDTCGGTATPDPCGPCDSPLVCISNVCCTPDSITQVCETVPEPDYECGDWADGCGGSVNCDPIVDAGSQTCDDRVPGEVCVAGECVDPGSALEPENTQGDSWETIYENCTDVAHDPGFRPPIFVRPTLQNTGANCPDKASGCPADATLTELGTTNITSPGLYENFYVDNQLRINASNVTLRNFEIRGNGAPCLMAEPGNTGVVIEYGSIIKGGAACQDGIWTQAPGMIIRHTWVDQYRNDCYNGSGHTGPVFIERSLCTRLGDNGGYGSSQHADTWQHWQSTAYACWLGSRVVPSYCPNFYKNSNVTQSSLDPPGKMYIYNSWLDGSTNVMLAGDGRLIRNNKFGNFTSTGRYWYDEAKNMGGNTFECDGSPVTTGQSVSPQLTCPWGFDNDPVVGWDGVDECGTDNSEPCAGNSSPMFCTGTADSQPIDPTEFCVSDGSGCIVTPAP